MSSQTALFEIFTAFEITNISVAIITNSFLIYLIIHRSSHEIGAYRHLLLAFVLNDIYFPIIHFLTLPVICTYKDAFIMFSHGLLTSRGVEGNFRPAAFLATMGFNAIMGICSSIIVFCSCSIVIHLRSEVVKWSCRTKKLQQQLFLTLIIQMLIPMGFVYFPCGFIINFPILGFRMNVFPNLVSASSTVFPLLDAFIIMYGMRSYRHAILSIFKNNSHMTLNVCSLTNTHTITRAAVRVT